MDTLHWIVTAHAALTWLLFVAWRVERCESAMWERNARHWMDAYSTDADKFTEHIKNPLWREKDAA